MTWQPGEPGEPGEPVLLLPYSKKQKQNNTANPQPSQIKVTSIHFPSSSEITGCYGANVSRFMCWTCNSVAFTLLRNMVHMCRHSVAHPITIKKQQRSQVGCGTWEMKQSFKFLTMFQITNSVMQAVNTYPNHRFTVSILNLVVFDFAALCMIIVSKFVGTQ